MAAKKIVKCPSCGGDHFILMHEGMFTNTKVADGEEPERAAIGNVVMLCTNCSHSYNAKVLCNGKD